MHVTNIVYIEGGLNSREKWQGSSIFLLRFRNYLIPCFKHISFN